MSALADYRMLWRAAVSQRHPNQVAVARRMVPLVTLVVAALAGAVTHDWVAALSCGLRVPFAVFIYFAVILFVPGAALLNTPVNARLAPRMRRRLMQMTACVWFAGAALPALLLGTSSGSVLLWFLGIGAWIIGFGVARGGYMLGAGLQLAAIVATLEWRDRLAAFNTPAALSVLALLLLVVGAGALRAIFPRGGERHWKLRGKLERAAERAKPGALFKSGEGWRIGANWYDAVLRRDCAQHKRGALLLHVLGPASHWTQLCLGLGLVLALLALIKLLLAPLASAEIIDTAAGIGWVLLITLMFMQQAVLQRTLARLAATPGEQALLRMAPLSAPAAQFNRQLGAVLLRSGLRDWALITAAILGATALTGASAYTLMMQACLCCLGLPLVAVLLRDHSKHTGIPGWWMFLSGVGTALLSGAAGWFAFRVLGLIGWPVMALTSAILAVLAVWWRWRLMLAAPVAFPVGRLA
ncbi:MAG TPA: hypothetical protein VF861_06035 [Telluria sp.]